MKPLAFLTVVTTVYHQPVDAQPVTVGTCSASRQLETDEYPYKRPNFRVGDKWQLLDLGWLKDKGISLIHLVNELPQLQQVPTRAEKDLIHSRVVELGIDVGDRIQEFAAVRPGFPAQFEPLFIDSIWIRCRNGAATCTLTLVPK